MLFWDFLTSSNLTSNISKSSCYRLIKFCCPSTSIRFSVWKSDFNEKRRKILDRSVGVQDIMQNIGKPRTLNCGQSAQIHPLGPFANLFDCWDFNVGISDCEVSGWVPRYNPITREALLREETIPAWLRFTWTFNYFKLAVSFFFFFFFFFW